VGLCSCTCGYINGGGIVENEVMCAAPDPKAGDDKGNGIDEDEE